MKSLLKKLLKIQENQNNNHEPDEAEIDRDLEEVGEEICRLVGAE